MFMKIAFTFLAIMIGFAVNAQEKHAIHNDSAAYVAEPHGRMATQQADTQNTSKRIKPLYHSDSHAKMMTRKELVELPSRDVRDAISLSPGVYQAKRGQEAQIGGARQGGTLYIIDGVQVMRR